MVKYDPVWRAVGRLRRLVATTCDRTEVRNIYTSNACTDGITPQGPIYRICGMVYSMGPADMINWFLRRGGRSASFVDLH